MKASHQQQLSEYLKVQKMQTIFINLNQMESQSANGQGQRCVQLKKQPIIIKQDLFSYCKTSDFHFLKTLKIYKSKTPDQLPMINAPVLQLLDLRVVQIKSVDKFAKGKYPELRKITVIQAQIKNIPKFQSPKLQNLCFRDGIVLRINQFCQELYPELISIVLFDNKITRLPKIFAPKLQWLGLYRNNISSINQFVEGNNPCLKKLDISFNCLESLPNLQKFSLLQQLSISVNLIQCLRDFSKGEYPNINKIIGYSNQIKFLPCIKAQNLAVLKLDINKIKSISNQFLCYNYLNLKSIDFSSNNLVQIPILNAPKIEQYFLSQNLIQQMENTSVIQKIEKLKRIENKQSKYLCLQIIYLWENKFKSIPLFLSSKYLSKLRLINLPMNEIESIELLSQINLEQVLEIQLQSNNLTTLKTFSRLRLPRLRLLRVQNNKIHQNWQFFKVILQKNASIQYKVNALNKKNIQLINQDDQNNKIQLEIQHKIQPKIKQMRLNEDLNNHNLNSIFKVKSQFIKLNYEVGKQNSFFKRDKWIQVFSRAWLNESNFKIRKN